MTAHRTTPDAHGEYAVVGDLDDGSLAVSVDRRGRYDSAPAIVSSDDRVPLAQAVAGDEYVVVKRDESPPVEVAWSGTGGNCLQVTIDGSVWVSTPDEDVEWLEREVCAYTALLNARRAETTGAAHGRA